MFWQAFYTTIPLLAFAVISPFCTSCSTQTRRGANIIFINFLLALGIVLRSLVTTELITYWVLCLNGVAHFLWNVLIQDY